MAFDLVFSGSRIEPSFYDVYDVETILDPVVVPEDEEAFATLKGMVGTVRKKESPDGQLYVMKSITKKNMVKERVQRECEINMKISHGNITRVHEIYETPDEVFLIMDYMGGGDLFDRVAATPTRSLPECDAHQYMHQLMGVVCYLHDIGIAHRDLKPENIMFETKEANSKLKVIDFGFAKRTEDTLATPIGTLQYVAPEVLEEGAVYDKSVDIWSVGCILYFMLFGKTPFLASSEEDIVARASTAEYQFPDNVVVSDLAKDLIMKLLRKEPTARLTAPQILSHRWMENGPTPSPLTTSGELVSSDPKHLNSLRVSINAVIDHARQEAETLTAQAQKSPRGPVPPANATGSISSTSPSSPDNSTGPLLLSAHDSPAYKKRTKRRPDPASTPSLDTKPS